MIGIISYDNSNFNTVFAAIRFLGLDATLVTTKKDFFACDKIILPGVGSFGSALNWIRKNEIDEKLIDWIKNGNHTMGICLGLQLMANSSEEAPDSKGLGLLDCSVKKIKCEENNSDLVHTGFNEVKLKDNFNIFDGIQSDRDFYFNHSFMVSAINESLILGDSEFYNIRIPAFVHFNNFFGMQFHPEKSHNNGLRLLLNFCEGKSL